MSIDLGPRSRSVDSSPVADHNRQDFLAGKTFESLEEAQAALDVCVAQYHCERPHQGIGMVPPIRRFELAVSEPFEVVAGADDPEPAMPEVVTDRRVVTRRVSGGGRISLATYKY